MERLDGCDSALGATDTCHADFSLLRTRIDPDVVDIGDQSGRLPTGPSRIRKILDKKELFVVVQDAFMTETASRADVVLPAALWGEKAGCFTNVDRTVHLSHKAVDPPGQARSDLDIFVDYAERMDFRDRDGASLIKWRTPEEAFEAWKACSKGRPCDYSGMSYAKLTGKSGIQWPCNEQFPDGARHLYVDGHFNTDPEYCETFGHDLDTGATVTATQYRADNPRGRAIIRASDYIAPYEEPDDSYPLWLTTGRIVYHFHTRTKTGRASALEEIAPDAFVEMNREDAMVYGIHEGDMVEVRSRRGYALAPARFSAIRQGVVFMPFHYGYWDDNTRPRAANEVTLPEWDPVSKQPHYKFCAVRIRRT